MEFYADYHVMWMNGTMQIFSWSGSSWVSINATTEEMSSAQDGDIIEISISRTILGLDASIDHVHVYGELLDTNPSSESTCCQAPASGSYFGYLH